MSKDDSRRERYAVAIYRAVQDPDWTPAYEAGDAALAVADEEISHAIGDRAALVLENARLRTEKEARNSWAEAAEATIERVRAAVDNVYACGGGSADLDEIQNALDGTS